MDAKRIEDDRESYWLLPDGSVLSAEDASTPEPGDVQRWFAWQSDGYLDRVVDASGREVVLTAAEERWLEERGEEHRERMQVDYDDMAAHGLDW